MKRGPTPVLSEIHFVDGRSVDLLDDLSECPYRASVSIQRFCQLEACGDSAGAPFKGSTGGIDFVVDMPLRRNRGRDRRFATRRTCAGNSREEKDRRKDEDLRALAVSHDQPSIEPGHPVLATSPARVEKGVAIDLPCCRHRTVCLETEVPRSGFSSRLDPTN